VRRFWWFVLITPIFGLAVLVFGTGLLQVIGIFAILWPLTIPARAVLGAWKTGGFFAAGVTLTLDDDYLLFAGNREAGMKLRLAAVRSIAKRHGFMLLRFGIGEFVAIPLSQLEERASVLESEIVRESELVAQMII
jgi:hypothetical protein